MILVTKWFGSFLCEEGKVMRAALFPKDPNEIAQRLDLMRRNAVLAEDHSLASSAKQVVDRRLSEYGKVVKFDSSFIKPETYGFSVDMYRAATILLAKAAVKSSVGPDVHLGQAVRAYDDLLFTVNILSERLHEWYGLHFPEFENVVGNEAFVKAISEHGSRDAIMAALKLEMDSIGADIAPEDMEAVKNLSRAMQESQASRAKLEKYLDVRMQQVAPNLATLAGPVIGARLIMQAGGLTRLASLPTGTVQLLGAEKAMFRHLKKGSNPPKHGIIFQHPLVHNAPLWQRGPLARTLAAKLSLAARADAYSRNDLTGLLKDQLDKRAAEIRRQRPSPPRKPAGRKDRRRR